MNGAFEGVSVASCYLFVGFHGGREYSQAGSTLRSGAVHAPVKPLETEACNKKKIANKQKDRPCISYTQVYHTRLYRYYRSHRSYRSCRPYRSYRPCISYTRYIIQDYIDNTDNTDNTDRIDHTDLTDHTDQENYLPLRSHRIP